MKHTIIQHYNHQLSAGTPFLVERYFYEEMTRCVYAPDAHQAIHLGILLHGSLKGIFHGSERIIHSPGAYLVAPWESHGATGWGKETELLLITLAQPELEKFFFTGTAELEQLLLLPHEDRCPASSTLMEYGRTLLELEIMAEPWRTLHQFQTIGRLFLELAMAASLRPRQSSAARRRLDPALELLRRRDGEPLTVEEAANCCSLGISRFSHLFRDVFGISFGAYEQQYRLNSAARMLLERRTTLKETAWRWGFTDASYFIKRFRQAFGITPGQYLQYRQK